MNATVAGSGVVVTSSRTSVKVETQLLVGLIRLTQPLLEGQLVPVFGKVHASVAGVTLPAFRAPRQRIGRRFQPRAPEIKPTPEVGPVCVIVNMNVEPARMFWPWHRIRVAREDEVAEVHVSRRGPRGRAHADHWSTSAPKAHSAAPHDR